MAPGPAAPPRETKLVQLIVFRLADEEFAVPIGEVREIVRSAPVTPVPGAPAFIKGMINVRGDIAVVVDLKARFSLPAGQPAEPRHIVIAAHGKNIFAFEVDEVTEVLRIAADEVKPSPETATRVEERYVTGFVLRGDRLIVLIDLMKALSEEALSQLAQARVK